ncbi:LysR substrate-binding domain-containing protein [Dokdonella immobilis]|uniref:Transcriptional regulator, LysR family n=1 Tax=Dokdonella immobilis TaxID=578942 RepID=A0A1I4VTH8_9GAMM|nr:LysR substrate-binding domain-containing protein [Dokdonella immobilis]SFN04359.1 transcriptional regulator, LysR family [Dokdonella immobilis]
MNVPQHHVTLRKLQYAVAVADSLSFRKAAEACFVSQPALSTQLAQMEQALGIRLFERDQRRVIITGAGREFIERARHILREMGDLEELARRSTDPLSGSLRIGVIPTISPYLLPRLTPALREAYPRLKFSWVEDKTRLLVRSLETGALDAVLLAIEANIGDVEREIIAEDPFVLVAPRGHALAASKAQVGIAELRDATVLVLQEGHCLGEQATAFCTRSSANVDAFRGTSLTTLVQMVAGGAGVTLVPKLALPHEVTDTELCVRDFSGAPPGRTIGLVWRKHYAFDAALRQVATTIRQAYSANK